MAVLVCGVVAASAATARAVPPTGACEAAFDFPETVRYGQLIMVGFDGTKLSDPGVRQARAYLREGLAGGLVFFDRNIQSPAQLRRLTRSLALASTRFPAFLAVDEEGGRVQRLQRRDGFRYERSARWVAGHLKPLPAKRYYRRLARQLANAGLNLNFGPVVDLDLNPDNPVIARQYRSFGHDPAQVAQYGAMFVDAHRAYHVATALKHFPGHGSSRHDTHRGLADVTRRWQVSELAPFRRLIGAGKADMVMTSHLVHRKWWSDRGEPASLAPRAVTGLLRKVLGFDGVIITDDLQMGAIQRRRGLGEAIVAALGAGNDMVLIGNVLSNARDPARLAIRAIRRAARNGRLDQRQLACSFLRVIDLKARRLMSLRF